VARADGRHRRCLDALVTAIVVEGLRVGFRAGDLLVLTAWALGSTAIAVRRFRWEPRR